MDNSDVVRKAQERLQVVQKRCEVHGVTKRNDIEAMEVTIKYGDLKRLIDIAGRSSGMIWNQEEWV